MKNKKNNTALMEALAHVQAAARIMSKLQGSNDPLYKVSSANDEPDFIELKIIADGLQEKLCRLVPRFRLLIYSGAPEGTVYKKADIEAERTKALAAAILNRTK